VEEMSEAFNKAIAFILPHEEEFARGHWGDENFVIVENVPGDAGGLTKYGIDARSHPGINIANLTRDKAIAIYDDEWNWRNLDALPEKLAIALFDVWVNGGYPVKWLQIAINKVGFGSPMQWARIGTNNSGGTLFYLPLTIDGDLGPKTLAAAAACDQAAVLRYFIAEREARFVAIAANNPQDRQFLPGWKARDLDLTKYLLAA
jgi:lysozyme family protein